MNKLTKITLWTSHNYWTNTFMIRFYNHVTRETVPTIPVIICGSAAWHFTVATAFVCPDSVCTLAFVLTSQIYEFTVNRSQSSITDTYSMYFRHCHWLHEFLAIVLQIKQRYLGCFFHPTIHHTTASAGKFQGEQGACHWIYRHTDNLVTTKPHHLVNRTKWSYIHYVVYLLN